MKWRRRDQEACLGGDKRIDSEERVEGGEETAVEAAESLVNIIAKEGKDVFAGREPERSWSGAGARMGRLLWQASQSVGVGQCFSRGDAFLLLLFWPPAEPSPAQNIRVPFDVC